MYVSAYNWNPYIRYCVAWKSLYPLLRTVETPVSVTGYDGNPYIRYCVQSKYRDPLLRIMEIPISATAYSGNPKPEPRILKLETPEAQNPKPKAQNPKSES